MNQQTIYRLGGMNQRLGGAFKVSVVDSEGKVVWEAPKWEKNLILNSGMNQVPYTAYADLMAYGIVGTGNRANSTHGNTSTVSQSGAMISLQPDPSFLSFTQSFNGYPGGTLEIGDTIVYDGGIGNVQVIGGITGTTCTVDKPLTIAPTTFTVWKTSQIGLQAEVKRAGNGISNTSIVSGATNSGTTFNGNIIAMQRTWDFSTEASPKTYYEVGVSWNQTVGNPGLTFSRLALPFPVLVDTGQRIRLAYQLQLTLNPTSSVERWDATITGWTVTSPSGSTTMGSESIQNVLVGGPNTDGVWNYPSVTYINYNGATTGVASLEPSSVGTSCQFFLSNISTSLQSFNSSVDRTGVVNATSVFPGYYQSSLGDVAPYQNAYVLNSYTVNKTATSGQSWVSQNIRSIGFGAGYPIQGYWYATQVGYQAFCFLFNKEQSKANTQTVTLTYKWTWDRSYVA